MRTICLLVLFLFQLLQNGCSNQGGTIAGNIPSPAPGLRVTAVQDGKTISSVEPAEKTGNFSLNLRAGTYDITITAPAYPFPIVMHQISVEKGKTTALETIALPSSSPGRGATLSGKITPTQATISLLSGQTERASLKTDPDGLYVFREIPAGDYTLRVTSRDYAPDSIPVTVSERGISRDVRLFYASTGEGLDWEAGKIRVTGRGVPPDKITNPTVRREMAKRAALSDAERKLVKAVSEIKTGPNQNLRSYLGEGNFTRIIEGYIKGYRITAERELNNGGIELDLELPLTGQNGLSRYLFD